MDARQFGSAQIFVVAVCFALAMLDGFDTQAIAYVAPVIAREWGLNVASFGPIFGAGLGGLTLGALLLGPAADRYGRKPALLASIVIFGIGSLITSLAQTYDALLWMRALTGLGLGGAMPNLIALTLEYSPTRLRATVVTVMFCGVPLGATAGGMLSNVMIPQFGWSSVFVLGGALPLAFAVLGVICLPESICYLLSTGASPEAIRRLLAKFGRSDTGTADLVLVGEERARGVSVARLFTEGRARKTLLIWTAFFANLLVMYFLINWLPTLAGEVGMPAGTGILATALLNFGGVIGGLAIGQLIDRVGKFAVLSGAYALSASAIAGIAALATTPALMLSLVLLAGCGIIGAQIGMNAVTAELYPTAIRASGIGWALGIGRVGSILGPVAGGFLIASKIATASIFYFTAAPALIAAIAVFALGVLHRSHLDQSPGALVAEELVLRRLTHNGKTTA